jgi:hypothetical protein
MTIVDHEVQRLSVEAALKTLLRIEESYASNRGLHEKLIFLEQKLICRASVLFTRFVPSCVTALPLTSACLAETECWNRTAFGYERRPHPLRLPGAPAVEHG